MLAARLWLDRRVPLRTPSNVLAGFEPDAGGTFFDLNALQDEFAGEAGSVVEVDIYHANRLLPLADEDVIDRVLNRYLAGCEPAFRGAGVVDASVLRFKGAVTLFGPGSHQHMPETATSLRNVFMAGDWLRQGPGAHGARGLSQEKAYVTGLAVQRRDREAPPGRRPHGAHPARGGRRAPLCGGQGCGSGGGGCGGRPRIELALFVMKRPLPNRRRLWGARELAVLAILTSLFSVLVA